MKETISVGTKINGFTVERVVALPDLRAEARLLSHDASCARFLHVHAPHDNENALAITFPTPPIDDTGVTHILEHSVLAGSKRFPVREPFFEMIKMSLATFINALTCQSFTCYPVSSPVRKDFFNLAEVYLDAVFHPLITPETFRREGHHFAFEKPGDTSSPLTLKGVVYSEMQGYASSPENRLYYLVHRHLYPDNPLGRESGGDPDSIPNLTYEAFKDFHATRYHPSNSLIFAYGDIDTSDLAAFLSKSLAGFTAEAPATVPMDAPKAFVTPREVEDVYPVGESDPIENADYLTLGWVVGNAIDPDVYTDWAVIDALLVGHDGSPLRKALIDSGIGADTCLTGTCNHAWKQEFLVGLKGADAARVADFEKLVTETLSTWAATPPGNDDVEAAFKQLAYSTLEVGKNYPLSVLNTVNFSWPYNGDPVAFLSPKTLLEACRNRWNADPLYFGKLIKEKLLDNPYRLRIVLRPDRTAAARDAAKLAECLEKRRAAFSEEERAKIDREAAELDALNGEANSPEKIALLPQLSKFDLPAAPNRIPFEKGDADGVTLLRNDVFSNGVNYLAGRINLAGIPDDLRDSLVFFLAAWNKMGAAGQNYAQIARRRASCTGALALSATSGHGIDGTFREELIVSLKTLDSTADEAFDLMTDLIFGTEANDPDRLRDLLDQAIVSCRETFMDEGYQLVRECSARFVSNVAAAAYRFSDNPDALHQLESHVRNFDACAAKAAADVVRIREFLLDPRRWSFGFTGTDATFARVTSRISSWTATARSRNPSPAAIPAFKRLAPPCDLPGAVPQMEGISVPGTVAYCSLAMPAPILGDSRTPLLEVAGTILTSEYCLPEIRFKGHAYAAGAGYNTTTGAFQLNSGWDPHIVETLGIFRAARDYVASHPWSQADVDRAIIATSATSVAPIRPAGATGLTLARNSYGITDELREENYAKRLSATPESLCDAIIDLFDEAMPRASTSIVANQESLEAARKAPIASSMRIVNP